MEQPSRLDAISTQASLLAQPQALLERYGRAIRGYLEALLGETDGEEAAHAFAVKIFLRKFEHWRPGLGRFRDYLKRAVHHAAIDFLREKGRYRQAGDLESVPDPAAACGRPADVWQDLCRAALLQAAFRRLRSYQDQHPSNVFYTLVRLLEQHGDDRSEQLAQRLTQESGRPFTAANTRKQMERSRRLLAQLLWEETCQTLDAPTPAQVEEELHTFGLMSYITDYLPPEQRTCG